MKFTPFADVDDLANALSLRMTACDPEIFAAAPSHGSGEYIALVRALAGVTGPKLALRTESAFQTAVSAPRFHRTSRISLTSSGT